jgi:LacI family transcriptional regulator
MDSLVNSPRPDRAVTLVDVARRAGVSLATASKALNGKARVSETTRAKVAEAARELAYSHNPLARGLSLGRSGTVGLLTSDLEGRFSLPILMGAEDTFGAGQLSVFLCDARGDAIRERHYIAALLSRRVDAIMVVGSRTDLRQSIGHNLPVPVIYVYTPSSDPDDLSITPDNVAGARLAVEHLLATGRTRIAHISGPIGDQASRDRAEGIRQALGQAGLALVHDTNHGEWTERWGRSACAMLLDQGIAPDAVLCDSDQIARGALDALKERGISVPKDIAIMGFDNWDVIVEGTHPLLTSVDWNLELLGRVAAERIFSALNGGSLGSGIEYLPCHLAVRASTTPET